LNNTPDVIGSLKQTGEKKLLSLLKQDKKEKKFIDISSAEYLHAIYTIQKFSSLCSVLEVCKFVKMMRGTPNYLMILKIYILTI